MMTRYIVFWLLAGLLVCCGCSSLVSSWNSFNPLVDGPVMAGARNPVVEIACMWQPAEGRGPKGVPARGFSGTVYFFSQKNAEPMLAKGDVRVYLFADAGSAKERSRPLHQYDFKSKAWQAHASQTSLGPGYEVFVPYPEQVHYQVRCQLRVRFQPPEGPPVWSEALSLVLDGPPRPDEEPLTWMSGQDSKTTPTNEIHVEHDRIPASKLGKREEEGTGEKRSDREDSGMEVETFDVSRLSHALNRRSRRASGGDGNDVDEDKEKVTTADYETEFNKADVSTREEHLAKHPLSRQSDLKKQEIIQRVLNSQGDSSLGSLDASAVDGSPHRRIAQKPSDSDSVSDASQHPLLRETEPEVTRQQSRHPLIERGDEKRHWRSLGDDHPLLRREGAFSHRRRFVEPRPNRAALFAREGGGNPHPKISDGNDSSAGNERVIKVPQGE